MLTGDERHPHRVRRAVVQVHRDLVLAAVGPVGLCDSEVRLGAAFGQVRWDVDLDAQFLRESRGLWVASGDKHASVKEKLES